MDNTPHPCKGCSSAPRTRHRDTTGNKRKTSELPTRVYSYGAAAPIEGAEEYERQLLLAHRYYNKLVEIERGRRDAYLAARRELFPDVEAAEVASKAAAATWDAALLALRACKSQDPAKPKRGKPVDLAPQKEALRLAREKTRAAWAVERAAKKAVQADPTLKARAVAINEVAYEAKRVARAASGVFWGTYLAVENAVDQASSGAEPPEFKRWDGSGTVSVQLQGDRGRGAALATGTFLRVRAPVAEVYALPPGRRRAACRWLGPAAPDGGYAMMRIGSEGRAPVWMKVPVLFHRPLPADAHVKWARYARIRVADAWEYRFQFVLESQAFLPPKTPKGSGKVAVDLGWRRMRGTLRAGYWADDRGGHGPLEVPVDVVTGIEKVRSLQVIRDRNLEGIKESITVMLDSMPLAVAGECSHVGQWRSARRVAKLVRLWGEAVGEGPRPPGLVEIDAWLKNDRHLWRWAGHFRDRMLGWRNETWSKLAARFAREYGAAVLEAFDLTTFADVPDPAGDEGDDHGGSPRRRAKALAACGELRDAIEWAFKKAGKPARRKPAEMTTQRCHLCGHPAGDRKTWDAKPSIMHTCDGCGAQWDQDYNACMNLLASGEEVEENGTPEESGNTEPREGQEEGTEASLENDATTGSVDDAA